jgi:hypothetical protein
MAELWGLFEVSCPEELVDGKQHVFLAFWTQQTVDFMILIVLIHILRMPLAIGKCGWMVLPIKPVVAMRAFVSIEFMTGHVRVV